MRLRYQKKSCSSKGTLRTISTNPREIAAIRALADRLPMATNRPSRLDKAIPAGDTQGVQNADRVGSPVTAVSGVFNGPFGNVETGRARQKTKSHLNATLGQISLKVADQQPEAKGQQGHQHQLPEQGSILGI